MMLAAATASRRMIPHAARRSGVAASLQSVINTTNNAILDKNNNNNTIGIRYMSELPYHLVVGMPALSPTMESGTISAWKIGEGETFSAGDSLAEIETDKATIDFEAQDDGVVAKLLVEAGSGEINVGVPIMVTVEEEDDVGAFKDFVPEVEEAAPAVEEEAPPAAAAAAAPAEVKEEAVAPPPPPPAAAPTPPPPPPPAAEPVAPPPPVVEEPVAAAAVTVGPSWGRLSTVSSPIVKTLSAEQKAYIEKYGSTGQIPL